MEWKKSNIKLTPTIVQLMYLVGKSCEGEKRHVNAIKERQIFKSISLETLTVEWIYKVCFMLTDWNKKCEKHKKKKKREDNFQAITNWINIIKTISEHEMERERETKREKEWKDIREITMVIDISAESIIIKGGGGSDDGTEATNKREETQMIHTMP